MRRAAVIAIGAALIVSAGALAVVAVRGAEPAATVGDRTSEVAATLRCPVCRNLSVEDSLSIVARQMRATIAERLRAGQTPEKIRDFFVSRFGPSILLTPRGGGVDLLAWILPVLIVGAGLVLLAGAVTRWTRGRGSARAGASADEAPIDPAERLRLEREVRDVEEPGWA